MINKIIELISKLFTALLATKVVKQLQTIKNLKRKILIDEKINEIDNIDVKHSDVTKWLCADKSKKESWNY